MSSEMSVMLLIPAGAVSGAALGWALLTFGPAAMVEAAERAGAHVVVTVIADLKTITHPETYRCAWTTVTEAPKQIQSLILVIRSLPWDDYASIVKHGLESLALLSSILEEVVSKAINPTAGVYAQRLLYGMLAMLIGNILFTLYRNIRFVWLVVYFIIRQYLRLLWAIILGIYWPVRLLRSRFHH